MAIKGKKLLGYKLQDKITGFTGVATGYVTYITGCSQFLLAPPMDKDGKLPDSMWFDEQRMLLCPDQTQIVLDNSATPGPDREAPKR